MRGNASKNSRPKDEPSGRGLWLTWVLVSALAPAGAGGATGDPLPQLLVRFGELYSKGRLAEARDTAKAVLSELEKSRASPDLDRAAGLNNLAAITGVLGEWDAAEPLFQEALEVCDRVAGPDAPARALLTYNLGGLQVQRGRYARAEALYEQSLAIWERIDGATQPEAAETLNNLGFLHMRQKNYQEAERLFDRALAIWEKDGDSPEHAVTLNNLALVKAGRGATAEAEALYRRSLAMEEAALGGEHPELATTMNGLGLVLAQQGKLDEAARLHRRALSILEVTLGPQDALTQETLRLLEGEAGEAVFQLILVRAQSDAASLVKRIDQGEDMGELARRHSVDSSAESGGHVAVSPSELRREVREELARLNRGQVSAPFQVGEAWAIVRKGK